MSFFNVCEYECFFFFCSGSDTYKMVLIVLQKSKNTSTFVSWQIDLTVVGINEIECA